MKTVKTDTGPFRKRPFFGLEEIERLCVSSLRQSGLLPSSPEPIRIERFIEKRFGVTPGYEDLPPGLLGYTQFGPGGVEGIVVSRELAEQADEDDTVSRRRLNTTMAHEGGHGLLHGYLFVLNSPEYSLFGESDLEPMRILCREIPLGTDESGKHYNKKWWEFQANKAMAAILLPRHLVRQVVSHLLVKYGPFGTAAMPKARVNAAIRLISDVFDVNPIVARIRVEALYGNDFESDLTS